MSDLRQAAQAALEAGLEREGWKLVPAHPTEEMLAATSWPGCAATDYAHMIAAAPAPPLRAALAEQDAEPVAWLIPGEGVYGFNDPYFGAADYKGERVPLFASPPRREWVSLTGEEIDRIRPKGSWWDRIEYARAIEAALKEKNHD